MLTYPNKIDNDNNFIIMEVRMSGSVAVTRAIACPDCCYY